MNLNEPITYAHAVAMIVGWTIGRIIAFFITRKMN